MDENICSKTVFGSNRAVYGPFTDCRLGFIHCRGLTMFNKKRSILNRLNKLRFFTMVCFLEKIYFSKFDIKKNCTGIDSINYYHSFLSQFILIVFFTIINYQNNFKLKSCCDIINHLIKKWR